MTPRLPRRWPLSAFLEAGTLVAILVVAGLILLLAALAGAVSDGETRALDQAVLLALRAPADLADPIGPPWLETMFADLTSLGSTTVLTIVTAIAIGYLLMARKPDAALLLLASVAGGMMLSTLLKLGVGRPRPDLVPHLAEVHTASFPSGHAMLSAATYLTIGALLSRVEGWRRMKIYILSVAVTLTLLVGVSRVYLGVHWPTDVLAGWCAGAAWAMLCWLVALALQRRGAVQEEAERGGG